MPRLAARLCLLLAAVLPPVSAGESYTVYLAEAMPEAALRKSLEPLFGGACPPVTFVRLAPTCRSGDEAQRQAHAIEAGVSRLPSLVLADDQGPFATLPLQHLHPEDLDRARALAAAPDRRAAHQRRLLAAHIYLLCARTALCPAQDEAGIQKAVAECRAVMQSDLCTPAQRQFLGLRCLYPLLMRQYTRAYTGAHTPYTEAKLLEAIAALEAARDVDRGSSDGKKAHEERERLRAARRKSRQFE